MTDPNKYQLMPAYTAEQFAELKEDIRQHGVLQPIEFDTDGNLLDGHHRFRAFSELIVEGHDLPMFDRVTRQFDNEEDKIAHVLSLNVRRRHLTPPQISELCGKLRLPPFNYTLAKIGQVVGMSAVGVWSAIARLDQATRDQIDQEARIVGKDGSVQLAFKVAPRIYQTGQATLQTMQREAVATIGAELLAEAEAAAQNGDGSSTVDLDPSVRFVVGSGENEGTVQIADSQLLLPSKPLVTESPEAITVGEAQKRISAFAWYGGKFSQLDWLLPLLPPCKHFVDVFGGSGAVVMNRPPSPMETYNDLDKDVVHFFRVIRNPNKLQELLRQLELTPYSREERTMAHLSLHRPESEELDEIERARRFFVIARQTVRGQVQMQHSPLGIWKFTRDVMSRGMAGTVSSWQYGIDGLAAVAARFRTIQVENYPAIRIIELYDTPDTLFYCLPPHTLIRTVDERLVPIRHIQAGEVLFGGRRVLRRMFKMYDGPMLTIKAQGLPDALSMTEDHRVVRIPSKPPNKRQETRTDAQLWSSREVVQARQLVVGDYLLVPLGGTEAIPNWPELNTVPRFRGVRKQAELLDTAELYRFLGYYTAEGHIQRYGKKFASGTILSFNVNEMETYASDAAACAYTSFGVEPQFQSGPNSSVVQVCVWSAAVAEFVEQVVVGTATTKRLSPEVMTAPITMQRELLIGWLRGDGGLWIDTNGRTKLTGTTASEALARQIFTIALRCGLRPNFKRRGHAFDVYFASKDASSLGWPTLARTSRTGRRIIQNTMLVRVRAVDEQPYYGPVYDLDVDGDDLFTAPYLLTHNCDPPYVQDTRETSHRRRDYTNEMSDTDHRDLAAALHKIRGRAAISGFPSQLYDELYGDWNKIMMPRISGASVAYRQDGNKEASDRIEVLWTNYPLGKGKEAQE